MLSGTLLTGNGEQKRAEMGLKLASAYLEQKALMQGLCILNASQGKKYLPFPHKDRM